MGLIKSTQAGTGAPSPQHRQHERTLAQLTDEFLSDPDPGNRRRAAFDLNTFPDAAQTLCSSLARETDVAVVDAVFTSLIRMKGHQVVEGLMPYLRSEYAPLRNKAVEALQAMPNDVGPYMELLVEDTDPDVRIFAINILGNLHHPMAHVWLQKVIEQDSNLNVCATAVDVLAEIGDTEQLSALEALPGRFGDEPLLKFAVDIAVQRIRGDQS